MSSLFMERGVMKVAKLGGEKGVRRRVRVKFGLGWRTRRLIFGRRGGEEEGGGGRGVQVDFFSAEWRYEFVGLEGSEDVTFGGSHYGERGGVILGDWSG